MKSNSFAVTAAAAFLLLGLGVAWYGLQQSRAAQGRLATLELRREALEAGLKQTEAKIAADKHEQGLLQAKARPAAAANPAAAAAAAGEPPLALLTSHPKLMAAFLAYFRASLGQRFGAFYQTSGMTPEQIAKFEDLMTKHQEDQMDLQATAQAQHLPATDPSIAALRKEQNEQFRSDQTALLGAAGLQQLQQYNRSQGAVAIAQGAASAALDSDPYTNTQVARLVQIVAAASPSFQQGGSIDPRSVDWDTALAQARTVLSPTQWAALQANVQMMRVSSLVQSYYAPAPK
jgi:hypothetical protein